jgi:hypothetical protein
MSQSEAGYWAEWYRPFAAGTKAAITTALREIADTTNQSN